MIPVYYCGNCRIFHGIFLSALSVIEHTEEVIGFYILTMDLSEYNPNFTPITEKQTAMLDAAVKEKNPQNFACLVDATDLYREHLYHGKNDNSGYTPYTLLRLLLDFTQTPDKIIYLDADTMCCSDIKQLWDIDVENYEFAAARDKVGHFFINYNYCNAGVLVLNMKKIRQTGLFALCRKKVFRQKMLMPDQTAMNKLSKSKLVLDYKFNEQRKIKPDTVIKHFCKGWLWIGPIFILYNYKQWERDKVHKKLKTDAFDKIYELYDKYDEQYHITESCK